MKGFDKLPRGRRGTTNRRIPPCLLLVLCWLLLPAWSALGQDTLEAQSIRFRLIPGGWYFVGSPPNETGRYADEAASHKVKLKPFYISVTEITNAQYGRFVTATGHKKPLYWQDRNLNGPNQPVVGVTWHDAVAFCRWMTKVTGAPHELPTEDQWEAAARGGLVAQLYPWGDAAPDAGGGFRANFHTTLPGATGFRFTAPVGSFPANGYGLLDMAGNVSEWCQDRYVPLRTGGPFKPGPLRLLKGGSWLSGPRELRPAARQSAPPHYADGYIGFRVVRLPLP
jgi:sulfatase modifying factor 1